MKEEKPCVKWDIRCFHYERRRVLCALLMIDLWKFLFNILMIKKNDQNEGGEDMLHLRPSIFNKKVVSHSISQYYKFKR